MVNSDSKQNQNLLKSYQRRVNNPESIYFDSNENLIFPDNVFLELYIGTISNQWTTKFEDQEKEAEYWLDRLFLLAMGGFRCKEGW